MKFGLALLIGLLLVGGCSHASAPPSPSPSPWIGTAIASGRLPGTQSTTADLGKHRLGASVWVDWVLTGPGDARAKFVLTLSRTQGMAYSATAGPASFGRRVVNHHGLSIFTIAPATYRVTLREVVPPQNHGYMVRFRVFTSRR